jgi:PleD family two-component response regulator
MSSNHGADAASSQRVVIVNGSPDMLGTVLDTALGTMLDARRYDVVFVESSSHAYSQVKRLRPNLVILCVRIDDPDGFQVLSMLKLDEETRDIPVLTCTSEHSPEESDDEEENAEPSESAWFQASKGAIGMN